MKFPVNFKLTTYALLAYSTATLASESSSLSLPSLQSHNYPGLAGQTELLMQKVLASPSAPGSLQSIYVNQIIPYSTQEQQKHFLQLSPQFKAIQYSQEKLDLLIHREVERFLYLDKVGFDELLEKELPEKWQRKEKPQEFFIVGYDDLKQGRKGKNPGYNTESFYQMYGITYNFGNVRILGGIGASESYMKLRPTYSKANYNTVWTSFGVSQSTEHWIFAFDALYGYSFLKTKRWIECLGQTARSSHDMWNISGAFKVGYIHDVGKVKLLAYDKVGYLYGQEDNYREHGSVGDNFSIKGENLSAIRNQLGLHLKGPSHRALHTFADAAWLYDYYLNNDAYQASFEGTQIFGQFIQTLPTKNYGRIRAGFQGEHKKILWQIAYTGLYGKKFAESSISVDVGYAF